MGVKQKDSCLLYKILDNYTKKFSESQAGLYKRKVKGGTNNDGN